MEKNSHTRVKFVFFCAVVFLLTLSIFSFTKIKKLIDVSHWVNHTNAVKLKLADVYSTLSEMEANQRGYIITDDSVFLDTYYKKAPLLTIYLDKIDSLIKDNPVQQINAKQLRSLITERKDYMQLVLNDTAMPTIRIKHMLLGRALMDDVRKCINNMKDKEDGLLDKRTLTYNQESTLTPRVAFFLILSALLIVIAAYYKIINDLRKADVLKHNLATTNNELKTKNEELKKNEERFFKMFDNNPVALSFGEIGSNKIAFANKLFYSYFGYTPQEVIGHTSEELQLVSPEENARLFPIIMSYLDDNRSREELRALPPDEIEQLLIKLRQKMYGDGFEVVYTRKNKETFYALIYYEIIEIGNKKYALTSYQDITERRSAEKKIEIQNADLMKMNKELESFNYISSHDLQEPLRKIQLLSSQVVEKDEQNLSDKGKELFKRIQNSAHKMQTLIDDLLAYSRTNAADRKFELTDIAKVIEEVRDDLRDDILTKQATFEVGKMPEAKIIPFQFRQLIYNLISNSLKFTASDRTPHIKINAEINLGAILNYEKLLPQTNYYHLSIVDNGIGFEPAYSEKIFEVFQRLHKKTDYTGTGIGLAIVKKIVDNHNGFIVAHGEPNKGARFDIYLPV